MGCAALPCESSCRQQTQLLPTEQVPPARRQRHVSQNTINRQPAGVLAMMDSLCAACASGPVADMGRCSLLENLGEEEQVGTKPFLQGTCCPCGAASVPDAALSKCCMKACPYWGGGPWPHEFMKSCWAMSAQGPPECMPAEGQSTL